MLLMRHGLIKLGFNTQPPEGGCDRLMLLFEWDATVSTHSHPKVAARAESLILVNMIVSTHSHPKVAAMVAASQGENTPFQHTATRRWLRIDGRAKRSRKRFNTQPPEGGCVCLCFSGGLRMYRFNTQPPEGGCKKSWAKSTRV